MLLHQNTFLLFLLLLICVKSWNLPASDFITQFAKVHDRSSVNFHIPEKTLVSSKLVKWYKSIQNAICLNLVAFQNETKAIDQDLNVFIPNEDETEKSIDYLKMAFSSRTPSSQDFWLIDISIWTSIEVLDGIKLDLDDDVYLYRIEDKAIQIYEYYEINPNIPRSIFPYGNWTSSGGLFLSSTDKWERRTNLQVKKFLPVSAHLLTIIIFFCNHNLGL